MLKTFEIEGLYDLFSYNLSFTKGVFIITGPNGFGKTTILNCINSVYDGEFWHFYFLKFKRINISFDNGHHIEVRREETLKVPLFGEPTKGIKVKVYYSDGNEEENFEITWQYLLRLARFQYRRDTSHVEEYLENNYSLIEDELFQRSMPNMLKYLFDKKCNFLESQRLVYGRIDSRGNQTGIVNTIDDVNDHIRSIYSMAHNVFSKTAQSIDGSFIERLSQLINKKSRTINEISASDLQQEIDKYRRYHLIEEMDVEVQLPSSYDLVKNLYLEDIKSKLGSLEKYYNLLSTFDQFVTGKGLSYKSIELGESGIVVRSVAGDEVPLNKLSSGEQNLMILAYHLIFEASTGDILLVDEPENSLHMSWLENLLQEYIRISKITDSQVIIATHSPTFIGSRWNMTYDLFENNRY